MCRILATVKIIGYIFWYLIYKYSWRDIVDDRWLMLSCKHDLHQLGLNFWSDLHVVYQAFTRGGYCEANINVYYLSMWQRWVAINMTDWGPFYNAKNEKPNPNFQIESVISRDVIHEKYCFYKLTADRNILTVIYFFTSSRCIILTVTIVKS